MIQVTLTLKCIKRVLEHLLRCCPFPRQSQIWVRSGTFSPQSEFAHQSYKESMVLGT